MASCLVSPCPGYVTLCKWLSLSALWFLHFKIKRVKFIISKPGFPNFRMPDTQGGTRLTYRFLDWHSEIGREDLGVPQGTWDPLQWPLHLKSEWANSTCPHLGLVSLHCPLAWFPFFTQGVFPSQFCALCALSCKTLSFETSLLAHILYLCGDLPSPSPHAVRQLPLAPRPQSRANIHKGDSFFEALHCLITKVSSLICLRSGFQNQHVNKKIHILMPK